MCRNTLDIHPQASRQPKTPMPETLATQARYSASVSIQSFRQILTSTATGAIEATRRCWSTSAPAGFFAYFRRHCNTNGKTSSSRSPLFAKIPLCQADFCHRIGSGRTRRTDRREPPPAMPPRRDGNILSPPNASASSSGIRSAKSPTDNAHAQAPNAVGLSVRLGSRFALHRSNTPVYENTSCRKRLSGLFAKGSGDTRSSRRSSPHSSASAALILETHFRYSGRTDPASRTVNPMV